MASPPSTPPIKTEKVSTPVREPISDEDEGLFVSDGEDDFEDLDLEDFEDDYDASFSKNGFYDESQEPLPNAVVYDPDFQSVQTATSGLIADLVGTIPEHSRDCIRFKHLLARASEYAKTDVTKPRRVNIVGKSGSGKTSLLNSLLGIPGHAKALAGSKACTHVPATYESPFPGQTRRFAVKVDFFTHKEITKVMEMTVKSFYDYHDKNHEHLDKEEVANLRTAADTALETLRTLFCARDEFATPENETAFFGQASKDDERKASMITLFVQWCDELVSSANVNGEDFHQTDSEQELRNYIKRFAFGVPKNKECSLWPIVKIIRESIAGIPMLKYVSLTDWPGSDDTNQLRANASAQRIYDCDEIWVVSSADRVATDPAATVNLIRYGQTIPCVLICTAFDDKIDNALAEELYELEWIDEQHRNMLADEEVLLDDVAKLQQRHQKVEDALQGKVPKSNKRRRLNDDQKAALEKKQGDLSAQINDKETEMSISREKRFILLVQARKAYIQQLIQEKGLPQHTTGGDLRVLFASNTHYTQHKIRTSEPGPVLSPLETGIPGIRHYILESAAPVEYKRVRNFLDNKIKILLAGIGFVTNTSDSNGYEEALKIVQEREEDVDTCKDRFYEDLEKDIRRKIIAPLQKTQEKHTKSALKVLDGKKQWAYASIKAFVNKRGCHGTNKQPYHSWTEEFMREATDQIKQLWKEFFEAEDGLMGLKDALQTSFTQHCRSVFEGLRTHGSSFCIDPDVFEDFTVGQIGEIEEACTEFQESFSGALR